ncbi:MAG: hypothetical protein ACOZAL_03005, partial [Patescibacteria group bacterium]
LNLILALVFLIIFAIILYSIDPYKASHFVFVIFYLVLFGLILSILNLIGKIPFWVRILVALAVIILLILKRGEF